MDELDVSAQFYLNQLQPLVGHAIVGLVYEVDEELGTFFGLNVRKGKSNKVLWILRDDEGNGPGSFQIQDLDPA